jgi:uncharacterized protein involved in response to NO
LAHLGVDDHGGGVGEVVAMNAIESVNVAMTASAPVFPATFNQHFLALITWGFIVPFIWGFSSRWFPPLLGLRKTHAKLLIPTLIVLFAGVFYAPLLGIAAVMFIIAIRLFEESRKAAFFVRLAYLWSVIAAILAVAVPQVPGASRHALTVGFFAAAVFAIGPRILPAFFNVRRLWSPRLMTASLTLLNIGCALRVASQALAYQHLSETAWAILPLSAVIEMTAVTLFGANTLLTLTTGSPLEAALKEAQA